MDDADRLALGREAEALLNNQAFKAALTNYRQRLQDQWADTPAEHLARREELHAELRALRGLEGALGAMLTNGASALYKLRRQG
jgi:hypothetical protein